MFSGDSFNSVVHSFNNKQLTLNQLRSTLSNIESETSQKQKDIENNNSQIEVNLMFNNVKTAVKIYVNFIYICAAVIKLTILSRKMNSQCDSSKISGELKISPEKTFPSFVQV